MRENAVEGSQTPDAIKAQASSTGHKKNLGIAEEFRVSKHGYSSKRFLGMDG
jgi:hypothetical protein